MELFPADFPGTLDLDLVKQDVNVGRSDLFVVNDLGILAELAEPARWIKDSLGTVHLIVAVEGGS